MQTVDLRQVKTIMAKAAGKEPPKFLGPWIFFYTKFTFIDEGKNYSELSEIQAKEKMQRYPKMEVFLLKFPQSQTPVPAIIKNRKLLQTEACTSFEKASEIIYLKTGVKIPESELMNKQKMNMKDNRPLIDQVRDLKKSNKDRIIAMVECHQIKDAKKRSECIKNKCKIK